MDLDLAHGNAQRVLRQRNALAVASLALGLLLAATFTVAEKRDREVVLVPTLRSQITLSSTAVSRDYLEMVTRDIASVNSILDLTDERARGQVKKDLMKVVAEQQGSQITQFFTPDTMEVDPKGLSSMVGGTLHTVVASKEVTTEHRTFQFRWSYNGVTLKLIGFGMIKKQDAAQ